jgi:glycine oxidase
VKQSAIIIGSGIIGCAIARDLSLRGVRCTVLDPRPVGGGATQASAGMLAPYVEAHDRGPMLDLCVRSLDLYDDWIASLQAEGREIEFGRIGTLEIALTGERAAALRRGQGDWLEPADVAAQVRQLAPTAGALRNSVHGYVDARQLARALADSAEQHGARFITARVERIESGAGALTVRTGLDAGAVLEAPIVIAAAGAWTNRIHGVAMPPLRPVRGQLLLADWGEGKLRTILWGPDCYIVPLRQAARGLLIGATVEEAGFEERTTEEGIGALFHAARTLLPALTRDRIREARVGLRPATPDGLPVIGRDHDVPGLLHASGHYRNGVLLAPLTAKVIADLLVEGRTAVDLEPFRSDRFENRSVPL